LAAAFNVARIPVGSFHPGDVRGLIVSRLLVGIDPDFHAARYRGIAALRRSTYANFHAKNCADKSLKKQSELFDAQTFVRYNTGNKENPSNRW